MKSSCFFIILLNKLIWFGKSIITIKDVFAKRRDIYPCNCTRICPNMYIYLYHLFDVDTQWWLVKQPGNTILYYPFVRSHCACPWYFSVSPAQAALYPMRASLSFHDTTIWLIFNHSVFIYYLKWSTVDNKQSFLVWPWIKLDWKL